MQVYNKFFKRFFDIFFSSFFILIFFPVFLICIIAIKLESKGSIFYLQKRLGYNGDIFTLFKFRSMTDKQRYNRQVYLSDDEITAVGRLIRRYKIDELPQLLNVFIGDMSFVGPRPCLPELKEIFDENGKLRITVKPGLSGLAQVNGNIYLTWPERWEYDRYYVENVSLILDLRIIFRTFLVILFGEKKFKKKVI